MNSPRFIESRRRSQFRLGTSAGLLLLGLGALVANQMQQRVIMRRENNLSVAGFVVHPADEPGLLTNFDLWPPHQVLQRVQGGTIRYVYADPDVCDCLYVGSPQAYDLYQKLWLERRPAHQQPNTVRISPDLPYKGI
jgi:hypothetical protein